MKLVAKILPFVALAMLLGLTVYGQNTGAVSVRVLDKDGKTPMPGVTVWIDSLITERGQIALRERLPVKTGRNGEASQSGLYAGRIRVTVLIDNVPVMVKGEATGDEIFLANGLDQRITMDLSKAPATPPPAAAAAPAAGGVSNADRDAARARYEKEAKDAADLTALFEAGKVAFTAKKYDEAITNFKGATDKDPKVHVIWANLARAYDGNKNYEEAIVAYKKAIELHTPEPNNNVSLSNYYLNLSLIEISIGKLDDGKLSIEKAASLNPANAGQAYYNLGATLINRGKHEEAIAPLKKAIELSPTYAPAYYQLGLTYVGTGKMAEAQPILTKFLECATSPDAAIAKGIMDELKKSAPTTYKSDEAIAKEKADAEKASKGGAKAPTTKGQTKE